MKRTLLLSAITIMGIFAVNAQKEWNFSNAPFGSAIPTYTANTIADGILIMAGATTSVVVDANAKKNGALSFTHRLKFGGSGAPDRTTTPNLPTTRALVVNVSGPGTISVCALSSSSSAARKLTITNGVDSLGFFDAPGSYTDASSNTVGLQTFNYTGAAGKIYIYSPSSGVNIYYLSVSSYLSAGISSTLADKGVIFNGTEIVNSKGLSLEVYSVLGKRVSSSKSTISTSNFQKGIYFVRAAGLNEALKITI